ncbi:hypothetical protein [Leptospira borgpetersenii]|nr:hypothetical protein [Leptospira borgpetersenii]
MRKKIYCAGWGAKSVARLKYLNSIAQMELSTGLNLDDLHLFELQ